MRAPSGSYTAALSRRARRRSPMISISKPSAAPVSPAEIIELMLEEFHAEILEMRYSNLVRSVFHVYLSSKDMRRLGPVLERTRAEADRALNEALATLNKKKKIRLPVAIEVKKTCPGTWSDLSAN